MIKKDFMLGKKLFFNAGIVGVIKDFHFGTLHDFHEHFEIYENSYINLSFYFNKRDKDFLTFEAVGKFHKDKENIILKMLDNKGNGLALFRCSIVGVGDSVLRIHAYFIEVVDEYGECWRIFDNGNFNVVQAASKTIKAMNFVYPFS